MPYVFPHEDLFMYITAALIVGLLFLRVRLASRRKAQQHEGVARMEEENEAPHSTKESALH